MSTIVETFKLKSRFPVTAPLICSEFRSYRNKRNWKGVVLVHVQQLWNISVNKHRRYLTDFLTNNSDNFGILQPNSYNGIRRLLYLRDWTKKSSVF